MLLTCLSDHIGAVTLGNHHERGAISLELIHVWVHAVGRCRAHRTTGIALRCLGRTGIEHRILLEILRHTLTGIQTSLQFCVSDVTGHDDSALQVDTGRDRILRQFLAYGINALVQVYFNALTAFTRLAQLLRNQLRGVGVHLLQPDAVGIDLGLDVAVGRTAHAHADGAGSAVTRQTNDTDVVSQIFTTELSTQTNLVSLNEQLLLQIDVAESATCLVTSRGQVVIELNRSQLHRQQVLLS